MEQNFASVPLDRAIARMISDIRQKNRAIKVPDAAIAATALYTHTPLVTRDKQGFGKVTGLEIITI